MFRLTDLREILRYIPEFRDRSFVIAIDGAVVADENFQNIVLDLALLRSLNIRVVLVHGAGLQVRQLAAKAGIRLSNSDGIGITDQLTLDVSIQAASKVSHTLLQALSDQDLRGAIPNVLVAHPAGILRGVDHQFTGKVERIDIQLLNVLMTNDIFPVIPPMGFDGTGRCYRLNSDAVAVEVAKAIGATKLIYLAAHKVLQKDEEVLRNLTADEAATILRSQRAELSPPEAISKLENAVRAARIGVPRIHIIDGTTPEGLLSEVFSKEGVGTLVHANEYQQIRRAQKRDVRALYALMQQGFEAEELLKRSRAELERTIEDYFVFEVDRNIIGCCALHLYPGEQKAELASVYVDTQYENRGVGRKLIRYTEEIARTSGFSTLFCLSTQAFNYFITKGGYKLGTPDDLPTARRQVYDRSGRKSQVLVKQLIES
ncbi:MAG: amino-acid N-acetyltransferase [Zavarzinella sp.]